jgi:multiple sugar transport system ATP-binding protein
MLGITQLLERRPGEMSGGERQRVAMGRALVRKPKVFLFDEPLSNLDAALRADIRVEIGALVRKLGATTLYVTHDHVEAMTLGDRICVLREGMLEQIGTPREVYETPQTAFVATFLGSPSMNMVLAHKEGEWLSCGQLRLRCDEATTPSEVFIGVRPENLRVGSDCPGDAIKAEAVVLAVEPLGAETHLHLESGTLRLRARIAGFDAPSRGEKVPIFFETSSLHTFETQGRQNRISLRLGARGL